MQQLWLLKLNWYEILPPDISQQWENFIKTLPDLEKIKIPRYFLETNAIRVILHGFADASSKGYGAVIYFQTVPINEESNCQLLCSKSRVAPTKIMTIPRFELSACLLLSKLTHKVISALKRIQQLTKDFQWKHIPSECNPADLISRGLDVKALAANDLWWKGPYLENLTASTPDSLPVSSFVTDECYSNELKTIPKLTLKLNIDSNFKDNLLNLTNNFHKLIRILAFIFRFITNCKSGVKQRDSLTLEEYGASAELKRLYKLVIKIETIANLLASEGIKWNLLPPRAPTFGGLWEAGVKSFKYHLKRVVGTSKLTLEEFLTVIVQIEGILNSRPFAPLSTDTDDFQVLTPGHFVIGKPINATPESDVTDKKDNLLNKWQKTQKYVQIIWKRWQNSY
ncbi:hypothetical protein AVEN_147041-1, partial [Araneus ventricosus]